MTTSEDILVIILSVFLGIFLLLGIIALIKTIQVLNYLKRITEKASQIADKAEAASEFLQNTASKIALTRFIGNIVKHARYKKGKEGESER